jgi:microcystin-dependent protein
VSRVQFPPDAVALMKDMVRRLDVLERSGGASTGVSGGSAPVGTIVAYWGVSAPAGWLLCNGGGFPAATYPDLAAHLGGTTLPNLKGRVPVGLDAAQTEFDTLGETGGSKTVALSTGELASHGHVQDSHTHPTSSDGSHTHGTSGFNNYVIERGAVEAQRIPDAGSTSDGVYVTYTATIPASATHSHTATGTAATNQTTGSGTAHQNLPPYIAIIWIIKAT